MKRIATVTMVAILLSLTIAVAMATTNDNNYDAPDLVATTVSLEGQETFIEEGDILFIGESYRIWGTEEFPATMNQAKISVGLIPVTPDEADTFTMESTDIFYATEWTILREQATNSYNWEIDPFLSKGYYFMIKIVDHGGDGGTYGQDVYYIGVIKILDPVQ